MAALGFNPPHLGTRSLRAYGKNKKKNHGKPEPGKEPAENTRPGPQMAHAHGGSAPARQHLRTHGALSTRANCWTRSTLTSTQGALAGHQAACSHVGTGANAVHGAPQLTSAMCPRGPDHGGRRRQERF